VKVAPRGTIAVPASPGLGYAVRRKRVEQCTVRREVFRAKRAPFPPPVADETQNLAGVRVGISLESASRNPVSISILRGKKWRIQVAMADETQNLAGVRVAFR